MRSLNLFCVVIMLLLSGIINAQNGYISPKTKIKKGVLPNGLTYYLYQNPATQGLIDFYLLQKAGAILENDDQNGLAHFLEHMCFKGTKHFPGRSVMNKFEEKGLVTSINAFTNIEHTVYGLNNIPTTDFDFLNDCLYLLHDWCNYLNMEEEAIESERGVIIEEMRTRRNLQFRLKEKEAPYVFNHSKYAHRFIAGDPDIIKNFKKETLVQFYKDWYRTDMQAIVIMGSFDIEAVEAQVKEVFSGIPTAENRKSIPEILIPDNPDTYFVEIEDAELHQGGTAFKIRHPRSYLPKDKHINSLLNYMLDQRIKALIDTDTLNFINIQAGYQSLAKKYGSYELLTVHRPGRAREALTEVLAMQKGILKYGFTEEEFNTAKSEIGKAFKSLRENYSKKANQMYFNSIKNHFLSNVDILDGDSKYKLYQEIIKDLKVADINKRFKELYEGKNKTIIVYKNGKDDYYLNEQEVLALESSAIAKQVLPIKEEVVNLNDENLYLHKGTLTGAKIEKIEKLKELAAEKWTLKNGATVYYKQNSDAHNSILLKAVSPGGKSVLSGDDLVNAEYMNLFASCFGIGNYSPEQLKALLNKEKVSYGFQVVESQEEVILNSTYSGAETMFEILYSLFESPGFSKKEFSKSLNRIQRNLHTQNVNYMNTLNDTVSKLVNGSDRVFTLNQKLVERLSFERMKGIYQSRFKDASNFTFYLIGGISKGKAKKMVEKYIGSIHSDYSNETFQSFKNPFPVGDTKKQFEYSMVDKKAGNWFMMNLEKRYTYEEEIAYMMIQDYLKETLSRVIREVMQATYHVDVTNYITYQSIKGCGFDISYECAPERVKEINEGLRMTLKYLSEKGMVKGDFDRIKNRFLFQGEPVKNNEYYNAELEIYDVRGKKEGQPDYADQLIKNMKWEYVNQLMMDYLTHANVLDVIYTSEKN